MKGQYFSYSYHILWPLLVIVFLMSSCSGNRELLKTVNLDITSSKVFENGFTGLAIYDPGAKKWVYEYNSKKYFIPASNTKLFTFYTGLQVLGDSVPAIRYTINNDSLIFTGTGDPSLLHKDLPESSVIDFLKHSDKNLFFMPAIYSESGLGPGWAWDDYNYYYSAEKSSLPVAGNTVIFSFKNAESIPEAYPKIFSDSTLLDKTKSERSGVKRDRHQNIFRYTVNPEKTDFERSVPFNTSEALAIKILEDSLQRNIEILHNDPDVNLKKTFYSIPTDSLYKRLLQQSDNFIAEQILLLAANQISDSLKTQIAIDHMKENFLKDLPQEPKWVDGSGLSRYNLQTPGNMVRLLEKILKEVPQDRLFELLPAGGVSGTLKSQFKNEQPFIYAKTGSLSNNYSLSGYLITKKGKLLIISFMNSNYMVPSSALKAEMEKIIENIRNLK